MSAGPDVVGLLAVLARLPDRTPAQRAAARTAASAHRAAGQMRRGRRWHTREVPAVRARRRAAAAVQPRDARGRWTSSPTVV